MSQQHKKSQSAENLSFIDDKWPGGEILGRLIMRYVLYDNGAVDRFHPESEKMYPKKHLAAINQAAIAFFDAHPNELTEDNLELMTCGERTECEEAFMKYPEFKALDDAIANWFN